MLKSCIYKVLLHHTFQLDELGLKHNVSEYKRSTSHLSYTCVVCTCCSFHEVLTIDTRILVKLAYHASYNSSLTKLIPI